MKISIIPRINMKILKNSFLINNIIKQYYLTEILINVNIKKYRKLIVQSISKKLFILCSKETNPNKFNS
jgi:hypothetical protein